MKNFLPPLWVIRRRWSNLGCRDRGDDADKNAAAESHVRHIEANSIKCTQCGPRIAVLEP